MVHGLAPEWGLDTSTVTLFTRGCDRKGTIASEYRVVSDCMHLLLDEYPRADRKVPLLNRSVWISIKFSY